MTDTYLVECYWAGASEADVAAAGERAAAAARELSGGGARVAFLRSLLVRDDEIVLCLFAADAAELVREASVRAGLPFERIVASAEFVNGQTEAVPPGKER